MIYANDLEQRTPYQSQRQVPCLPLFYIAASVTIVSRSFTDQPEPYTLDRTLRWVQRQVAPTLKMLKKIDKGNGTDYMETIEQQAKLTEKHEMIIKQQTTPAKDLVES